MDTKMKTFAEFRVRLAEELDRLEEQRAAR